MGFINAIRAFCYFATSFRKSASLMPFSSISTIRSRTMFFSGSVFALLSCAIAASTVDGEKSASDISSNASNEFGSPLFAILDIHPFKTVDQCTDTSIILRYIDERNIFEVELAISIVDDNAHEYVILIVSNVDNVSLLAGILGDGIRRFLGEMVVHVIVAEEISSAVNSEFYELFVK